MCCAACTLDIVEMIVWIGLDWVLFSIVCFGVGNKHIIASRYLQFVLAHLICFFFDFPEYDMKLFVHFCTPDRSFKITVRQYCGRRVVDNWIEIRLIFVFVFILYVYVSLIMVLIKTI